MYRSLWLLALLFTTIGTAHALPRERIPGAGDLPVLDAEPEPQEDPVCQDCWIQPRMSAGQVSTFDLGFDPRIGWSNSGSKVISVDLLVYDNATNNLLRTVPLTSACGVTTSTNGLLIGGGLFVINGLSRGTLSTASSAWTTYRFNIRLTVRTSTGAYATFLSYSKVARAAR